jgi:hypothetical protein
VFWLVFEILRLLKDFVVTTFSLPIEIVRAVWGLVIHSVSGFAGLIKGTAAVGQSAHQGASTFGTIKDIWTNIGRYITRVISTTYNFTVYTTINLYKHKESYWMSFEAYMRANRGAVWKRVQQVFGLLLLYYVVTAVWKAW